MTKVVLGMSMSLDGIAGPESADADGMDVFTAILGWQFPPVLLGRGVRLFDAARADLRCIETIHGEGAAHLRYALR